MNSPPLSVTDFDYELPRRLIAQRPTAQRSASRLLVLDPDQRRMPERERRTGRGSLPPPDLGEDAARGGEGDGNLVRESYTICSFSALPNLLVPGDLLVFNDTRVIAARIYGAKTTGGRIELLIEEVLSRHVATARARSSKPLRVDGTVDLGAGGRARCVSRRGELLGLEFSLPVSEVLARVGQIPLPPYIDRAVDAADGERYQTIFSRVDGAIAAPTASLHFDEPLMSALRGRGIETAFITLHIGAGTFQPIRVEDPSLHRMHAERVEVATATARCIRAARREGRRVIAVGTTTVRALESAAVGGEIAAFSGRTDLFIVPGFEFRCVDALITNFHLPRSTLLMMVSAFVGRERILHAYRYAVQEQLRFFSYGDAMFITHKSAAR